MNNVKSLHGVAIPGEPVPEVVSLLEDMLKEAKSGSLRSIAVAGIQANNHVVTAWHEEGNYFSLIGALAWLSQRLIAVDAEPSDD